MDRAPFAQRGEIAVSVFNEVIRQIEKVEAGHVDITGPAQAYLA